MSSAQSGKLVAKAKGAAQKKEKVSVQKQVGKSSETTLQAFEYNSPTILGNKKDISGEWPPAYNPAVIETAWYEWWEKSGFFNPDNQTNIDKANAGKRFTIVIPPPNITGALHIGHGLTNSVQDSLIRFYRMMGYETCYLPGTDHAGIATQSVVERNLMARDGKSRYDIGREAFVNLTWHWKEEYGSRICTQLRKLGSSLDWSRLVFTLDEERVRVHNESFVTLFNRGLIYRDNRLVNWDCHLRTAVSDVEVEYLEVKSPISIPVRGHEPGKKYPFGWLWSFAYKIVPDEYAGLTQDSLAEVFSTGKLMFACEECKQRIHARENAQKKNTEVVEENASCCNPACLFTKPEVVIATTRPETMIGDTAVAVHPEDPRYAHLHGKFVFHPTIVGKKIPIILDAVLVDMSFGTGCVKITPAHDPNDYECGRRHNLDFVTMLNFDGRISDVGGSLFQGMARFDCRIKLVTHLRALGLFRGRTPNPMAIGTCQRSGDIIEPMLKPQWYLDCTHMAKRALDAVLAPKTPEDSLIITPADHVETWRRYLGQIRPWCISRQLWWGHRIPCYRYVAKNGELPAGDHTDDWVAATCEEDARSRALERLQKTDPSLTLADVTVVQDEDVTDTWFSSGLFPFSSFNGADRNRFYPGTVLETGHDILFFWVARMVMLSLELNGCLPFREVYLHAMVRDAHGEKMSKSKGNVVDPLDVIHGVSLDELHNRLRGSNLPKDEIERAIKCQKADFPGGIATCGTDALRFSLCAYTAQGRNINLDVNKIVAYRNFCNKVFNAVKFGCVYCGIAPLDSGADTVGFVATELCRYKNFADFITQSAAQLATPTHVASAWILSRLYVAVRAVTASMRMFRIADACAAIHTFWYDDLCDVYLEVMKPVISAFPPETPPVGPAAALDRTVFYACLDQGLRLLHPFMPYLTEELFQHLPRWRDDASLQTLMMAAFPTNVSRAFSFGDSREMSSYDEFLRTPGVEAGVYASDSCLFNGSLNSCVETLKAIITACRAIRGQYRIPPSKTPGFYIVCERNSVEQKALDMCMPFMTALCGTTDLSIMHMREDGSYDKPAQCGCSILSGRLIVYMRLKGMIDADAELQRLEKEIRQTTDMRAKLVSLMDGANYEKMPERLKKENTEKLAGFDMKLSQARELVADFQSLK